jgi:hypothetical protein
VLKAAMSGVEGAVVTPLIVLAALADVVARRGQRQREPGE